MKLYSFLSASMPLVLVCAVACRGASGDANRTLATPRTQAAPIVVDPRQPVVIGASMVLTGPNADAGTEDSHAIVAEVNRWKATNGGRIKGHEITMTSRMMDALSPTSPRQPRSDSWRSAGWSV